MANREVAAPVAVALQGTSPTVDIDALLTAFLAGRNRNTIAGYSKDLADFQRFTQAISVEEACRRLLANGPGPANMLALSYRSQMVERGLAPASINRRLAALRSVAHLARTVGMVGWSLEIQNVRCEVLRDTRGPGKHAFREMLAFLAQRRHPKAIRDTAILHLLYDLALRCGEVVSLHLEDLDLGKGTLWVKGKGRGQKELLTLPEPTRLALSAWLDVRGPGSGALFTNFDRAGKGKHLTAGGVYWSIRRLGEKVGVKVRPHGLRHTAITECCKMAQAHGLGIEEVADFSRHSRKSISILLVYRDRERNRQGELASMVAGT